MDTQVLDAQKPIYTSRLKFYEKTAQVFRAIHALPDADMTILQVNRDGTDLVPWIHSAAKAYTRLLYEYLDQLQRETGPSAKEEREMYQKITAAWHVCEILYFSLEEHATRGQALADWMYMSNCRALLKFDVQGIYHFKQSIEHPEFWPFVFKCLVYARHRTLIDLLNHVLEQAGNETTLESLRTLRSLIQQMPVTPTTREGPEASMFMERRQYWQDCLVKAFDDMDTSHENVRQAILLMSGQDAPIYAHTDNMVEVLVAAMFYTYPLASRDEIHNFAGMLYKCYKHKDDWTGISSSFLTGDTYTALENCSHLDWWFLAHLTDLISFSEDADIHMVPLQLHLTNRKQVDKVEPRVFFGVNYAACLLDKESVWRYGLDYLTTCGDLGMTYFKRYLDRIPLSNKESVDAFMSYCDQHDLVTEREQVYKRLAVEATQHDDFQTAITYHCANNRFMAVDELFNKMINLYIHTGNLVDIHDLKPEVRQMCVRKSRLASFYFDYKCFRERYNSQQYDTVLKVYISLLTSRHIPIYFVPIICLEGVALLEDPHLTFDHGTLHVLDQRLQDIRNENDTSGWEKLCMYLSHEDESAKTSTSVDTVFFDFMTLVISRSRDRLQHAAGCYVR